MISKQSQFDVTTTLDRLEVALNEKGIEVRALEGEIGRTIQLMEGVKAARVHLVMPDPGSFRSNRQSPSASVVIRTTTGDTFGAARAIRHRRRRRDRRWRWARGRYDGGPHERGDSPRRGALHGNASPI